ncbi:alpha-mannosidase [Verrucomicrobium sp. GAS474]|uniref:glycoside hydrolase family 38 N-terminal domain-containing protein n=1 Tax=Verrucomicrobium sp. GAS474 TaxID=1882831 RepID=UPI00087BE7E0|nr:alpha-mannosidase [Verrucomicrobium sp. GAS474]SDU02850.1 alpha-mannosidase [Verrucomicrobium sp. GAS474]
MQIHLISNAHLDPVWLWDWREGLNEGLITVRTILDLMDEDKDLTFIRGESLIYEHIEETDPATFRRIARYVKAGRWDVVGGTYIQPDTNLAGAETLARHFTRGLRYFESRFGVRPTVAWQADSFGHTAGLPEIFAAAGIDSFAFTRPDDKVLKLEEPAFWWEGAGGARILAYRPLVGWYGSEHDEMPRRLDSLLAAAKTSRIENAACFYGLGNHGGGPCRRQLADIRAWAKAHPEVQVFHSGLHRFFGALRQEIQGRKLVLPTRRGELNYCLRGCYSSVAKLKFPYRRAESLLNRAEKTDSVIAALARRSGADLSRAWDGVLFNSFHDILPGSSIERAMDDQIAWIGGVLHESQRVELRALNGLTARVDTRVAAPAEGHPSGVAFLAWNPHPWPFVGHVEAEACLDYRPIFPYQNRAAEVPLQVLGHNGAAVSFQEVTTENRSIVDLPWRKRVVVPVTLPAFGWNVLEMGWVEGKRRLAKTPESGKARGETTPGRAAIDNGIYRLEAAMGARTIRLLHKGKEVFARGGFAASVFDDVWGSWGGMREEAESIHLDQVREEWEVTGLELLESGPERALLWICLSGARSRIELSCSLYRGDEKVDVSARVLWNERSARLKLLFPVGDTAEFEVPGASVVRGPSGEVPGGRWFRVPEKGGEGFGFVSDALYNFDGLDGRIGATVVRASRYADDVPTPASDKPWLPAVDAGELKFRFVLASGRADLPRLSRELEQPPLVTIAPPGKGTLHRKGSLAALHPSSLDLLALKRAEDGKGFVLRVQARAGRSVEARLEWLGEKIALGPIAGGGIATFLLIRGAKGWKAANVDIAERPAKRSASRRR